MSFDPVPIEDNQIGEGHLDDAPMYEILMVLHRTQTTGRLSIAGEGGENHLFFMRGQPVGVTLAERVHPLGQLLLELGRINGATFVRAQRLIAEAQRFPGQVYKELGAVDEASLKDVLNLQAQRKTEHFCRLRGRPFQFGKGFTFLNGFHSVPLHVHAVIFMALRQQLDESAREAWLASLAGKFVGLRERDGGLPAPLAVYGFGAAEERFVARLAAGAESVEVLGDTGTLPREEMAVLLRYLDVLGRLDVRDASQLPAPSAALVAPTDEDVFQSNAKAPVAEGPSRPQDPVTGMGVPAKVLPGKGAADPGARAEVTPVIYFPMRPPPRREDAPDSAAAVSAAAVSAAAKAPPPVAPPAPTLPAAPPSAAPAARVAPSAAPPPAAPAPRPAAEASPPKPKAKGRRTEPEPSQGSSVVSTLRREKTELIPLPSIVIGSELAADTLDD